MLAVSKEPLFTADYRMCRHKFLKKITGDLFWVPGKIKVRTGKNIVGSGAFYNNPTRRIRVLLGRTSIYCNGLI